MRRSKTAETLAALGIHNTHDLLVRYADKGKDVLCRYHIPAPRSVLSRKTSVYSPSHPTNPKAPWYDYGQRTFCGKIAESMPEAIAWATERYGIVEWAQSPLGKEMIPTVVRERALAAARKVRS